MKNLSKLLFINFMIPCASIASSQFCFEEQVLVYCETEFEQNKSLNGYFVKSGQHYDFSARRAFDGDWCEYTVKTITNVMTSGPFCMEFEESAESTELTIDSVKSKTNKWTYFQ